MRGWRLIYDGFDPAQQRLREALCTLGNGYMASRGAAWHARADDVHYPATYLAGGYNRQVTRVADRDIENEDLVNLPSWLPLAFRLDGGEWLDLRQGTVHGYRQLLHLREGILYVRFRHEDPAGRTIHVESRRLVHMESLHLAALEVVLTPENWSGRVEVRTALDGQVVNAGVERYRKLNNVHLRPVSAEVVDPETIRLAVETSQSGLRVAEAARTRLYLDDDRLSVPRTDLLCPGYVAQQASVEVEQGQPLRIEKLVAIYSSRDKAISEPSLEATTAVRRLEGMEPLVDRHTRAWERRWRRFEIGTEERDQADGERTALILRLHIFHLLQTASPHTIELDVGAPARGLHGEAYRGHIFWDELFVFPLLNFRIPEITRSLLKYRYMRLEEARAAARREGYEGAMFPWQSGSNGREESQRVHLNPRSGRWIPDNSHLQRHINVAIAYNVWQYYQVSGDLEFMNFYGGELILEIARFLASLATYNEDLDRFEILHVMGPDEFSDGYPDADEPGLNNNAYTNVMTVWVLRCALELLDQLPEFRRVDLCQKLEISDAEIRRWDEISRRMRVVFHDEVIISQYEGYGELEELDWDRYRERYGDIHRLDRILESEGDTPNRYKVSKQADVLMLFYLLTSDDLAALMGRLGYRFDPEWIPHNIRYYARRTSHGSTLSRVVHSWVTARSDREQSWELFVEALNSDVADVQGGTTPEGIHLGAMAGTVDLVQRCYTGLDARRDVLWFDPYLPDELTELTLHIRYRGHELDVCLTPDELVISTPWSGLGSVPVAVRGEDYELGDGETLRVALRPAVAEGAT